MYLTELTNEQRRQLIDVVQVFAAWRDADRKAVSGSLRWVSRKGAEYLYRKSGKSERSLGRRSPATEAIMNEHGRIRNRLRQTAARLKTMARVNRALYLNRVPKDAANVLRELDSARLLGSHLFVIGTNALYAYEMRAAVLFESSLLATSDFDLLWDARERLRLVVTGIFSGRSPRHLEESGPNILDYGQRSRQGTECQWLLRRSFLPRGRACPKPTGA